MADVTNEGAATGGIDVINSVAVGVLVVLLAPTTLVFHLFVEQVFQR